MARFETVSRGRGSSLFPLGRSLSPAEKCTQENVCTSSSHVISHLHMRTAWNRTLQSEKLPLNGVVDHLEPRVLVLVSPSTTIFPREVNHRHPIGRELDLTVRAHVRANTNKSSATTRISKTSLRGFMQKDYDSLLKQMRTRGASFHVHQKPTRGQRSCMVKELIGAVQDLQRDRSNLPQTYLTLHVVPGPR